MTILLAQFTLSIHFCDVRGITKTTKPPLYQLTQLIADA